MRKLLSEEQVTRYKTDGAIAGIPIMSREEAFEMRDRFIALEDSVEGELQARYRIKAHLPFPFLCALIRHPVMLDAVEDLIGPDIVVWGSSFFTKKAHDRRFVSWHQDSTYYGLEPPESITAWIGFTDSTPETGCVRFIPGSHRGPAIVEHVETYDPSNLLSRGQTIEDIDEGKARNLVVRAGEMSVHHNKTIHSSAPNPSDQPRIGFAVHIAAAHVRQVQFEGATGVVVRGEDRERNWLPEIEPGEDFDPACLAALDHAWDQYKTAMKAPYEQ